MPWTRAQNLRVLFLVKLTAHETLTESPRNRRGDAGRSDFPAVVLHRLRPPKTTHHDACGSPSSSHGDRRRSRPPTPERDDEADAARPRRKHVRDRQELDHERRQE